MKRAVLLFILIIACAQEELPPSPPPPGDTGTAGRAIGGIALSNATLPSWAGPILYTDITPERAREGETVKVTVEKPSFVTTKFYAHVFMYFFNKKSNVWEKVSLNAAESGKVTQQWAENKAVFSFSADPNRFVQGNNFLVVYWCIDTDARDDKGNKVWNCNSKKWGLGAFELLPKASPNLIEQNIGQANYLSSRQETTTEGVEYTAEYQTTTGVKSTVKVTVFSDVAAAKRTLAQNLAFLQTVSTTRANTCGFLIPGATTSFSWITNTSRVVVQTAGTTLDESIVNAYNQKHPSNCFLIPELQRILEGKTGFCGNKIIDGDEICDTSRDSACPNLCKPDCTCAVLGASSSGICGDFMIQKPNSAGAVENCEPPQKRDPVTGQVVSGSWCFLRDPLTSAITGNGVCSEQCGCVPGTVTYPKCGNGKCEQGETSASCAPDCPADTLAPLIDAVTPRFQSTVQQLVNYELQAHDLSPVTCHAETDGAKEQMTRAGITWTLPKSLSAGAHTVVFSCTDAGNRTSNTTIPFNVQGANQSTSNATQTSERAAVPVQETTPPKTVEIAIQNFAFSPQIININAGDSVRWTNRDSAPHTATSTGGPVSFNTGRLDQGQSNIVQFSTPGTYTYKCEFHPSMTATIIVAAPSTQTTTSLDGACIEGCPTECQV